MKKIYFILAVLVVIGAVFLFILPDPRNVDKDTAVAIALGPAYEEFGAKHFDCILGPVMFHDKKKNREKQVPFYYFFKRSYYINIIIRNKELEEPLNTITYTIDANNGKLIKR